jgi:hypothetical protein
MTRARQHLHLVQPMRLFRSHQHRHGDGHVLTMRSRFIPKGILDLFERRVHGDAGLRPAPATASAIRVDVGARMREMWDLLQSLLFGRFFGSGPAPRASGMVTRNKIGGYMRQLRRIMPRAVR